MELLIRVVDKVGTDIYKDVGCTKRGHVIVAMPDGHDWTPNELSYPGWRIVRVTGISDAESGALLVTEPGLVTNRMLQRRAFKVNLDDTTLPAAVISFIADNSRKTPIGTIALAKIRTLKTQLQPVKDPDLLP